MPPSCPKCQNTTFEMQDLKVRSANFILNAVTCAMCGTIIAVMEELSLSRALTMIGERLGVDVTS